MWNDFLLYCFVFSFSFLFLSFSYILRYSFYLGNGILFGAEWIFISLSLQHNWTTFYDYQRYFCTTRTCVWYFWFSIVFYLNLILCCLRHNGDLNNILLYEICFFELFTKFCLRFVFECYTLFPALALGPSNKIILQKCKNNLTNKQTKQTILTHCPRDSITNKKKLKNHLHPSLSFAPLCWGENSLQTRCPSPTGVTFRLAAVAPTRSTTRPPSRSPARNRWWKRWSASSGRPSGRRTSTRCWNAMGPAPNRT